MTNDDSQVGLAALVVRIGERLLVIPKEAVVAAGAVDQVVPVPGSQGNIAGVTYFDDNIEAIIDLAPKLQTTSPLDNPQRQGVKLDSGGHRGVIPVDEILGEERVTEGGGDDGRSASAAPLVTGTIDTERGALLLLDPEAVFKNWRG